MYDYMKALQKRFDRQPHPDLDSQVEYAQKELRWNMDAAGKSWRQMGSIPSSWRKKNTSAVRRNKWMLDPDPCGIYRSNADL